MEEWRKVKGFENYECSSLGRLKTFNWKNKGLERIMKPAKDKSGYLRTVLVDSEGKHNTVKVHRIIAKTFIDNPEGKEEVNHKNGVKTDNSVVNLEWATRQENIQHCIDNGFQRVLKGEEVGNSILTANQVIEIRKKFKPRVYTRKMLSEEYGVKECTIKDVILRRSWKHLD